MSVDDFRAESPLQEAPPAPERPGWRKWLLPLSFLGPALLLLGVWVVYPMVATMWRSLFNDRGYRVRLVRQLRADLHRGAAPDRAQEQRPLGPDRPRGGDGRRPGLRRADRTHPLVGRVQDRRLHAARDLAVRRRRDLADHVPAGPGHRRDQRRHRGGQGGIRHCGGALAEPNRRRTTSLARSNRGTS